MAAQGTPISLLLTTLQSPVPPLSTAREPLLLFLPSFAGTYVLVVTVFSIHAEQRRRASKDCFLGRASEPLQVCGLPLPVDRTLTGCSGLKGKSSNRFSSDGHPSLLWRLVIG